jgi:hypothetical protein
MCHYVLLRKDTGEYIRENPITGRYTTRKLSLAQRFEDFEEAQRIAKTLRKLGRVYTVVPRIRHRAMAVR